MSATNVPESEQYAYLESRQLGHQIELIPIGKSGQLFLVEFATLPYVTEEKVAAASVVFDSIATAEDLHIPAQTRAADVMWTSHPEQNIPRSSSTNLIPMIGKRLNIFNT